MLKVVGAGVIFSVGMLWGMQMKYQLAEHVRQLICWKEVLLMLAGEISYAKSPLREAFLHIGSMGKAPFGELLEEVSDRLGRERGKNLYEIWRSVLKDHRTEIFFSTEEFEMLEKFGENLGYLDIKMQLNHLELYRQQVEVKIAQAQGELAVKQKMYQYLSVMSGLFVILVLI